MYPKKHKRKAATHRGNRKHYSIPVKRDVYERIMTVAHVLKESPGAVIERLFQPAK